jgi:DNA adenine methylase
LWEPNEGDPLDLLNLLRRVIQERQTDYKWASSPGEIPNYLSLEAFESLQRNGMRKIQSRGDKTLSPFVKWAGGKSQLLKQFARLYPARFKTYFEPFLGGGAVFFDLHSKGKINKAILSDSNSDLMNLWSAVKYSVTELVEELEILQKRSSDRAAYYESRKEFNLLSLNDGFLSKPHVRKAALMLYLNKTCFNGLYRVNSQGKFNVPFGRYKSPSLYKRPKIMAIHQALNHENKVELRCEDFGSCVRDAEKGDFVYFDPPYQPISKTSSFTSYTAGGFGEEQQERLAQTFRDLYSRGCYVMESNSYSEEFLEELYSDYFPQGFHEVRASRAISSVGSGRGAIREFVILTYPARAKYMKLDKGS